MSVTCETYFKMSLHKHKSNLQSDSQDSVYFPVCIQLNPINRIIFLEFKSFARNIKTEQTVAYQYIINLITSNSINSASQMSLTKTYISEPTA